MKKQAFVLTLGAVLFAVTMLLGVLISAKAEWGSAGSGGLWLYRQTPSGRRCDRV